MTNPSLSQIKNEKFISSIEASTRLCVTNDYVSMLCRQGKVDAKRIGRKWFVDPESLEIYLGRMQGLKDERSKKLSAQLRKEYVTLTTSAPVISKKPEWTHTFAPKHAPWFGSKVKLYAGMATVIALPLFIFGVAFGSPIKTFLVQPNATQTANAWDAWTSGLQQVLYPVSKTAISSSTDSAQKAHIASDANTPAVQAAAPAKTIVETIYKNAAPVNPAGYVTQTDLTEQLNALAGSMKELTATQNPQSNASLYATLWGAIALSQKIDSLPSTVTIGGSNVVTSATLPSLAQLTGTPTYGQLLVGNSSGGFDLVSTSSLGIVGGGGGTVLNGTAGQVAYFDDTNTALGTSTLFITPQGFVGIGTNNPLGALTIDQGSTAGDPFSGTGAFLIGGTNFTTGNHLFMEFGRTADTGSGVGYIQAGIAGVGAGNLALNPSGGNVGIGTTAPTHTLDVTGDINFTGNLYQNGNLFSGSSQWDSNGSDIYFNTGNLGIGTSSPSATLDVRGSVHVTPASYDPNVNGPKSSGLYAEWWNSQPDRYTPDYSITPDATGVQDPSLNLYDNRLGGISSVDINARISGWVKADYSETYTFCSNSDDGSRVWVNGIEVVTDNWNDQPMNESCGTIDLTANTWYPYYVEYYQGGGDAGLLLTWSSSSLGADQPIPEDHTTNDGAFVGQDMGENGGLTLSSLPGTQKILDIRDSNNNEASFFTATTSYFGTNVGIGTTSPGSLFAIGTSTGAAGINFTLGTTTFNTAGGINLAAGGCFSIAGVCITGGGGGSSQWTGDTASIYYSGNVGLGTTTPQSALSVVGTSTLDTIVPQVGGNFIQGVVKNTINGSGAWGSGLALGTDGFARIAYLNWDTNSLVYMRCTDAECLSPVSTTVETNAMDYDYPANNNILVLGPDGFARILYMDTNGNLQLVHCLNDDCSSTAVDPITSGNNANTGKYGTSLVMGDDGYARVIFTDYAGDDHTHLLRCTDADCTAPVDDDLGLVDYGYYGGSGLAIGPDHFPRIVVRNYDDYSLQMLRCTDDDCTSPVVTTIDPNTSIDPGEYGIALAMGSDGFPRVAYVDSNDYSLWYAQCTDEDCTAPVITHLPQTSGNSEYTGFGMALRSGDLASIAYQDNTANLNGHVLNCTDAACDTYDDVTVDTLGSDGALYSGSPLVIGSDNLPRLLYGDYETALKFAKFNSLDGSSSGVAGSTVGTADSTFSDIFGTNLHAEHLYLNGSLLNISAGVNGNLGIGTTSPGSLLSIGNTGGINFTLGTTTFNTAGGINLASGCFSIGGTCIAGSSQWTGDTANIYYSGNVGIGTTTPTHALDIWGSTGADFGASVTNTNSSGYADSAYVNDLSHSGYVGVGGSTSSGDAFGDRTFLQSYDTAGLSLVADNSGDIRFYTGGEDNSHERLRIASNGNVGIGTTTPQHALDVVGDINFTGNLYQNGVLFSGGGTNPPGLNGSTYTAKSADVSGQMAASFGVVFSADGTSMYVTSGALIYQYALSTAWDASSATYSGNSFDITSQSSDAYQLAFNSDGTLLYVNGGASVIYEYALDTPWDITTATYTGNSLDVSGETTYNVNVALSSDGTSLYVNNYFAGTIFQYTLSTPWDLSSATYGDSVTLSGPGTLADEHFTSDGSHMVASYFPFDPSEITTLKEYTLSVPWDITTATDESESFNSSPLQTIGLFAMNADATKFYMPTGEGITPPAVYEFAAGLGTNGSWVSSGSNVYFTGGNVGIGSTSPSQALTITGNVYDAGIWGEGPTIASVGDTEEGDTTTMFFDANRGAFWAGEWDSNVATTSIGYSSAVFGEANLAEGYASAVVGGYKNLTYGDNSFIGGGQNNTVSGQESAAFGSYMNVTGSNSVGIGLSGLPFVPYTLSQDNTFAIMGGNVGIGTTSPAYSLDVNGDINFTGNLYHNGSLFSGSSQWNGTGSDIYFNTGNVGIGTDNPTAPLEVSSGSDGVSGFKFTNLNSNSVASSTATGILGVNADGEVVISPVTAPLTSQAIAYWDGLNDPSVSGQAYPTATLTGEAAFSTGNGVQLTTADTGQSGSINWSFAQLPFERTQFNFRAGGGSGEPPADSTWFYSYADGVPTDEHGTGITSGYIIYFSEYHGCIGLTYGPYDDGAQCDNGGGTTSGHTLQPLESAAVANIGDDNWHNVDISTLDNRIIVRWDGVVVIDYTDIYGRDLTNTKFGFGARTGLYDNNHYIKGLVVTKLGTNISEYGIANTTAIQNNLYWDSTNSFLGIGSSTPSAALSVNGALAATGHASIGNLGGVDTLTDWFDTTYQGTSPVNSTLTLNDQFVGDMSSLNFGSSLIADKTYNNTGTGGSISNLYANAVVGADSTGSLSYLGGANVAVNNFGSGEVGQMVGGDFATNNYGNAVDSSYGLYFEGVNNYGAGSITSGYGAYFAPPTAGGGVLHNVYGLYIADQSGVADTSSFNIYSAGNGLNYFGGNVGIGTTSPSALLTLWGTDTSATTASLLGCQQRLKH